MIAPFSIRLADSASAPVKERLTPTEIDLSSAAAEPIAATASKAAPAAARKAVRRLTACPVMVPPVDLALAGTALRRVGRRKTRTILYKRRRVISAIANRASRG